MDCTKNENVCSVKKENKLGYYRLHTIWKTDSFFINITSKDGAWRGEMTPNNVKKMSEILNMTPEEYLQNCRAALTCHDGQQGMSYAVEDNSFIWKKVDDEDSGIKIKMGSVVLQPASFIDTIQNLVTAALDCNNKLLKEVNELRIEKKKLTTNRNELLRKLEELIKVKDLMEDDLYTKFLLLLNSKKKKIKELENNENLSKGKSVNICQNKNTKNPYEMETDDDIQYDSDPPPQKVIKKSKNRNEKGNHAIEDSNQDSNDFTSKQCIKEDGSEPSTSKAVVNEKKFLLPSTKDELSDFFFGSS